MHRHVIAPARFFSQVPNEIIRHPRLSSDAVRLLTWQLSLPDDVDEPLSKTAERAGMGKAAFQKAKRELLEEGYLHERRYQGDRGRWVTTQLVSNVPLTREEAEEALRGEPAPTGPPPSAAPPAVGEPTHRSVGGQPPNTPEENTSHQPAAPAAAEALLRSLAHTDPRLAMSARTARQWAPLAAPWLERGIAHDQLRRTLTEGLDGARSPLAVLRWRLEHALPDLPRQDIPAPQPPPRTARMRECAGTHTQPRLFLPEADEDRCSACLEADPEPMPPIADSPGYSAFRAARRARQLGTPAAHPTVA
ncbi:hypothetical protein [Streptomyces gobiensis]|uniref:hypothetical protein n=1 Tax=Streptomyces gobiensis TaxID=2875706 RepID=UPI001E5E6CAA|nr:hypothetical protein [Streptomyces gobiensis]UGY90765.1 hypothetical protein test1122_02835 [Streptomyces gobiensis]